MEIGRRSGRRADAVSEFLRLDQGTEAGRRRQLAALSLVGAGSMGVVALYQTGLARHLPEPPLSFLDADRVDASGEAYAALLAPDAAIGLASYGVTLTLATMGLPDRPRRRPWLSLALAGKVAVDALGSAYLTAEQLSKHRALCLYCLVAAAASVASVPAALAEAREAVRSLSAR